PNVTERRAPWGAVTLVLLTGSVYVHEPPLHVVWVVASVPPFAAYETQSPWFLNDFPSDVWRLPQLCWHSFALPELPPPAAATATPTDRQSAATAAKMTVFRSTKLPSLPLTRDSLSASGRRPRRMPRPPV